jgi:hypothetical protein
MKSAGNICTPHTEGYRTRERQQEAFRNEVRAKIAMLRFRRQQAKLGLVRN